MTELTDELADKPRREIDTRHRSVRNLFRWLTPNPKLPAGLPKAAAGECEALAHWAVTFLPDSEELTVGLRKLLEAKDCFVRAALDAS